MEGHIFLLQTYGFQVLLPSFYLSPVILFDFFCISGAVLVIRPDSGDPPIVVVKVLNILGK